MRLKGRHWVLLWLVLFLVVALAVAARQSAAIRTAQRVGELERERLALEAKRADLERRIREAGSRRVLGATAERLGLRYPGEREQQTLVAPFLAPEAPVAP
jgi:predicted Holliday junction resolvase-like endonuclease